MRENDKLYAHTKLKSDKKLNIQHLAPKNHIISFQSKTAVKSTLTKMIII